MRQHHEQQRHNQQRRRQNNNNNNNRNRNQSLAQRALDSNGPEVKIRGTAAHICKKYQSLARDSQLSGNRVRAENYLQHADHYYRIVLVAQAQQAQQQQQQQQRQQNQARPQTLPNEAHNELNEGKHNEEAYNETLNEGENGYSSNVQEAVSVAPSEPTEPKEIRNIAEDSN